MSLMIIFAAELIRSVRYTLTEGFKRSVWSYLEPCGAPVYELDGPLGLDGSNSGIYVLRYHVTSDKQIFSITTMLLYHI